MDADGDFVVAWWLSFSEGTFDSIGVYAQRYNAAGETQGNEFLVNTTTANNQYNASVAMDDDGDFVIAWQSQLQDGSEYGIYAQRYNAAGVTQGGEFRVNATTAGNQSLPAASMDADGDFVVAWQSNLQDGSGTGIYAQRLQRDRCATRQRVSRQYLHHWQSRQRGGSDGCRRRFRRRLGQRCAGF